MKLVCPSRAVTIVPKSCLLQIFTALEKATGFEDNVAVFTSTPTSIIFHHPCLESSQCPGKRFRASVEVCAGIIVVLATY